MFKSRIVASLILLAGLMSEPAWGQVGGGSPVYTNWFPQGNSPSVSITTASSAHLYPGTGPTAKVCNNGTADVYVNPFGTSNSVVATTNSYLIKAGLCQNYNLKPSTTQYTYWAAITASSTTTMYVETGLGTPTGFGGAGGGSLPIGPAGGDLAGTYPNPTVAHVSPSVLGLPQVNVTTSTPAIVCDGTTNNSSAMATLMAAYSTTGAWFNFPAGVCKFGSALGLIIPNDGGSAGDHPHQPTYIFQGVGSSWDGYNQPQTSYLTATVFDLRGTNTRGMIQTFGAGYLGFYDLTLTDKGSSAGNAFVYSTATTITADNISLVGTGCGGSSPGFADQDGFVFGGPKVDTYTTDPDSGFQGYGTTIHHVNFSGIQRIAVIGPATNGIDMRAIRAHSCDGSYAYGLSATPSVASAGTGYAVNDVISLAGSPYFSGWAQVVVTSVNGGGGVTGIKMINPGAYPSAPSSPVAQLYTYRGATAGTGTGFTATASWGHNGAAFDLNGIGANGNYFQFTTLDLKGYPYGMNVSASDNFIDAIFQDINQPGGLVTTVYGVRIFNGAINHIHTRGSANLPYQQEYDEDAAATPGAVNNCNTSIIFALRGNASDNSCVPYLNVPSLVAGMPIPGGPISPQVKFVGGSDFPVTVQPQLAQSGGAQPMMKVLRSAADSSPGANIFEWDYDGEMQWGGSNYGQITFGSSTRCNTSTGFVQFSCDVEWILKTPLVIWENASGTTVGAFDMTSGWYYGSGMTAQGAGSINALTLYQNNTAISSLFLSKTLTSAHLFVGNGSNVATDVAASGDVVLANTGAFTVSKVNGVSYGASPSTNTVPVVTGSNTVTYEAVPNAALANSATTVNGQTCTLGSSCTVTAAASAVTVGTTTIGSGTTTRVLFDNAGTLGEYTISGTGNVCMTTSCSMTTPALGTPSAAVLTNATGLPVSSGITGFGTGVATALAVNTGSAGAFVVNGGALGTPSSGVATNLTGTASSLTAGSVTGLSVTAGKTLTVSNSLTLTATDGSTLAIGAGGTLASAAYVATGTSGATIPLLNGTNTWSAAQTFTATAHFDSVGTNFRLKADGTTSKDWGMFVSAGGVMSFSTWDGATSGFSFSNAGVMSFLVAPTTIGGAVVPLCFVSGLGNAVQKGSGVDCNVSARRYKTNEHPLLHGLDWVMAMRPETYNWIADGKPSLGLIADDMAKIDTSLASFTDDGLVNGTRYDLTVAVTVKAIQELQAEVQQLRQMIYDVAGSTTGVLPANDNNTTVVFPFAASSH